MTPRKCQDMGIEPTILISTKLGDFNNVCRRITSAIEHPHLSIPENEAGRSRKHYHKLKNHSLMFVSVFASLDGCINESVIPPITCFSERMFLSIKR
uniref:Uncharacterized protein n=1 Tax=Cucumis sativus TaxID=3659 RepID=A0A0A0LAS5_CUCSA